MAAKDIKVCSSPEDFFRDRLDSAKEYLESTVSQEVENYIVNLLVECISSTTMTGFSQDEKDLMDAPLAFTLLEAMNQPAPKKYDSLKRLADVSLYIAGFFQDYFNRKTYDVDYYIMLGSSAYSHISGLSDFAGEGQSITYTKLAKRFPTCVDLVACISELPGKKKDADLLSLYHRWTKTNSKRLHKILLDAGITPVMEHIKPA